MNPNWAFDRFSVSLGMAEVNTVNIYVYMRGQRCGPYEKMHLQEMWKRGQLPTDTLYWHDGMSKWAVISDLFADMTIANIAATSANPDSMQGLPNAAIPE